MPQQKFLYEKNGGGEARLFVDYPEVMKDNPKWIIDQAENRLQPGDILHIPKNIVKALLEASDKRQAKPNGSGHVVQLPSGSIDGLQWK